MEVTFEELCDILLQKEVEIYRLKKEIVALKNNIADLKLETTIDKQNDSEGEDENAKIN